MKTDSGWFKKQRTTGQNNSEYKDELKENLYVVQKGKVPDLCTLEVLTGVIGFSIPR